MGDPRRFEVLARFLRTTFPVAAMVADVAGGHGELAFWLAELVLRPVVVDPRPAALLRSLPGFAGGTLFDAVGRVVCEASLAVDAVRALRLRAAGYRIHLRAIPEAITTQNRLLVGVPVAPAAAPGPAAGAPAGVEGRTAAGINRWAG